MSEGLHDVVMLFVVGLAGFPILFPLSIFALFCQSSLALAIILLYAGHYAFILRLK